jgi:hypothetical protein
MMDAPPRQFEAPTQGDLLEGIFDRLDRFGDGKNLSNGGVLEKKHPALQCFEGDPCPAETREPFSA